MPKTTFQHIFRDMNDNLFGRNEKCKRFFHVHALRKFFINTCNHNNSDLANFNLILGHFNKSAVHDAYNEINTEVMKIFNDPEKLRKMKELLNQ